MVRGIEAIQKGLEHAGIDAYRVGDTTVHVAERVRFHLMDSGIRVVAGESGIEVRFTARSQRSGNPRLDEGALFELVRSALSPAAKKEGFEEVEAKREKVTDPMDPTNILDVWYEVTYARTVECVEEVVAAVRWALSLERFVGHGRSSTDG